MQSQTLVINPDEDGVTHINVWSKAKTELGRQLSNFAHTPFTHPVHGYFASIEGYWYWCGSGMQHDALRNLHGFTAKSAGMRYEFVFRPEDEFQDLIREGLRLKLEQNPGLLAAFINSKLPFVHYFVYPGNVVKKEKHNWQMEYLEELRREFKQTPPAIAEQSVNPNMRRSAEWSEHDMEWVMDQLG